MKIWLFFLSIFTGSLIHEHYTRECEFGNFDKIKNKKHKKNTKKTNKKKQKKTNVYNYEPSRLSLALVIFNLNMATAVGEGLAIEFHPQNKNHTSFFTVYKARHLDIIILIIGI